MVDMHSVCHASRLVIHLQITNPDSTSLKQQETVRIRPYFCDEHESSPLYDAVRMYNSGTGSLVDTREPCISLAFPQVDGKFISVQHALVISGFVLHLPVLDSPAPLFAQTTPSFLLRIPIVVESFDTVRSFRAASCLLLTPWP